MKDTSPMVSVLILTYNQKDWIRQTIESILSQKTTYEYEIIIGEDYSTDGTYEICKEYVYKYPNVRFAHQTQNLGVAGNFANCIKHSKGKYIMVCAGDDFWHNTNKIQIQVDYMESHPECVICHTDLNVFNVNSGILIENRNQSKGIVPPEGRIQDKILSGKEHISAVTMCLRKEIVDKYVPLEKYTELKFPREDWPTLIIMSAYGDINYIPISTATYRTGHESITNTLDYDKIKKRCQQDKTMTEYLYSLFPNLGPFKDGWYYDQVVYRLLLVAAYQNNDYESAKEFAKEFDKTRLRPNKMSKMAKTYLTFKIYRYLRQVRRGDLQIF